jgi:hypothetical protein
MKIHSDKVENGPPHTFCARDVRIILAKVPRGWIEGLTEVRLANGPGPRAYLFRSEGRLTIYSRGGTKKEVLVAVLSTLAAPSLNIKNVVARSPSRPEQHRIDQFIQPLIDDLLPEIEAPKKRADVPLKFIPFPNDPA